MGSGAIFEASRILNDFYNELKDEKYLTFNPSIIAGGTEVSSDGGKLSVTGKGNVVPARVIVRGDLRFISEEQKAAAREKMKRIVSKSLPGASAKITFRDEIPAMSPKPANYELLKVLDRVSQDLGLGPIEPLDPGEGVRVTSPLLRICCPALTDSAPLEETRTPKVNTPIWTP